jgi:hypothetical protein
LREWITTDSRNTPSTTNPEDEEIVDSPGKDRNASMPEQVRPNPYWKKMMTMMMISCNFAECPSHLDFATLTFYGNCEPV